MTKLDKINKMFEFIGTKSTVLSASIESFEFGINRMFQELGIDPTEDLALTNKIAEVKSMIRNELNTHFETKIVPLYERTLSEEEIDAVLAFHESPMAKSFKAKETLLTSAIKAEAEAMQVRLADRTKAMLEEGLSEDTKQVNG